MSAISILQDINPDLSISDLENLLVIMTDRHIGNLLVSLYVLNQLANDVPDSLTIYCVVDSNLLGLAQHLVPDIKFVPYNLRGKNIPWTTKLRHISNLVKLSLTKRFGAAVDLYGHSESLAIARLSSAKFRSCYYAKPRLKKHYHWNGDTVEINPQHQIDYYHFPFIPLGLPKTVHSLKVHEKVERTQALRNKLIELGCTFSKPIIALHTGAGKSYKLWPSHYWATLIELLNEKGKEVVLIGAGSDEQQIAQILAMTKGNAINLYGKLNLIETIDLGFLIESLVGNDSGPIHLLSLTPAKVFSLFGPTDSKLWAPLSDQGQIIRSDTPCLPACKKGSCKRDNSCLEMLQPEEVFIKIFAN